MAKEIFDFKAFSELKYNLYEKQYAKTQVVKKAKAAIILYKYALGSRKNLTLIIPFKKMDLAVLAYKAIKKDKSIHAIKRTALAKLVHEKKGEVTLEIKKGGLTVDLIQTNLVQLFSNPDLPAGPIALELKVTGASDDVSVDINNDGVIDGEDGDKNQDGVLDTVIDTSTIVELKEEFLKAQELLKQSKTLNETAKTEARNKVSAMFDALMPKLENFLEYSDQKPALKTATRIKENIEKFQNALSGSSSTPEGPNKKLNVLTGGISRKATQLLKDFQSEIAAFDKENEMGESLLAKLESISKMGKAKTA